MGAIRMAVTNLGAAPARVPVRVDTLTRIRCLIAEGSEADLAAALNLVDGCLNASAREVANKLRRDRYRDMRDGVITYEEYRRICDVLADMVL